MAPDQCRIILRYTYHDRIHNVFRDCETEFEHIPNFTNYLRWEPERAMAIGYGKVDEERLKNSRSSNVRVSIWYRTGDQAKEVHFQNAAGLAAFLDENPELAKDLQYKKKNSNGPEGPL
jgi:hypothetical protein